MTDEQWLWLFANQSLDNDEKLESMCDSCRDEVTSKTRCTRCGKIISSNNDNDIEESFINDGFDLEKYEAMKNKQNIQNTQNENDPLDDDIDIDLVNQILDSVGDE